MSEARTERLTIEEINGRTAAVSEHLDGFLTVLDSIRWTLADAVTTPAERESVLRLGSSLAHLQIQLAATAAYVSGLRTDAVVTYAATAKGSADV